MPKLYPYPTYNQMPINDETRPLDSFGWLDNMPGKYTNILMKNIEYIHSLYVFNQHATPAEKYFLSVYENESDKYYALHRIYKEIATRHERLVKAHEMYIAQQARPVSQIQMEEAAEEVAETNRWTARGFSEEEQAARRLERGIFCVNMLTDDELLETHIDQDGCGYLVYDKMDGKYTTVFVSPDTTGIHEGKVYYFKKEGYNVNRTFALRSAHIQARGMIINWRKAYQQAKEKEQMENNKRRNARVDHVRQAFNQVDNNLNNDIF